ncbi:MAG: RNA polymerase sigma factor [Ruminococcaceae bacterium]|nr:RNA polymerase sigma factor [Oscillospiraceae bacterium]
MDIGELSYREYLDGDEQGLVRIIRDFRDGLILYLNSIVGNITVAEELCEDTFVRLGVKRPRYSGKAAFKTWLYTIAHNIAIDHLRKVARARTVPLDECGEIAADEAYLEGSCIREETKITVHRTMARLKAEYRQVLWLVYFEEMSVKDAAGVMKKSPHATEMLVHRAKLALKRELESEGFIYEEL